MVPLVHYKAGSVVFHDLPGMARFRDYFKLYGPSVMPLDRSGVIRFPVRTKNLFPLPQMRPGFAKTYEDICNERARELLERADRLDTPLYAFWSGGIDSTCVLVSLLKNCTAKQKDRIVVLMSKDSIAEYSDFYHGYIRGKIRCASAEIFPFLLGTNSFLVSGEHNDQLFGSDVIASAIQQFSFDAVMARYDPELLVNFFAKRLDGDIGRATWYAMLFERLARGAPIALKSNYDVLWWINFTLKWQNVYMRMLSFATRRCLNTENLRDYYAPFFNTEDFQLWSMSNLDKRVKDDWRWYKWPAKEVIYDFTKDAFYRDNKIKRGSLKFLVLQQTPCRFIDERLVFHKDIPPDSLYEADNDFQEAA